MILRIFLSFFFLTNKNIDQPKKYRRKLKYKFLNRNNITKIEDTPKRDPIIKLALNLWVKIYPKIRMETKNKINRII